MSELAARQHGVVARSQLAALGLGAGAIEMRLARRRLHRLHRGIYAVGHPCLTEEGRWMAAVLAGGCGAALSHAAAGALWGFHRPGGARVAVTSPRRRQSRPGVRFYHSCLPEDERTTKEGIPVTSVARTLFDLASVVSPGRLARAVTEAEIRHLWDSLSLEDLLARHPRRPGAAALRLVTGGHPAITRSDLEDRFIDLVDRAGLPRPAMNSALHLGDRWIEPDCAWFAHGLIVELDGYATHRTRAAYERDRARDRALIAGGWRVIRITWRQLLAEPDALARDLWAALAGPRRGPGPGGMTRR